MIGIDKAYTADVITQVLSEKLEDKTVEINDLSDLLDMLVLIQGKDGLVLIEVNIVNDEFVGMHCAELPDGTILELSATDMIIFRTELYLFPHDEMK